MDGSRSLSNEHQQQSIVDRFSPGIRSPFDNPRRIRPVRLQHLLLINVFVLQSIEVLAMEPIHVEGDVKLEMVKSEEQQERKIDLPTKPDELKGVEETISAEPSIAAIPMASSARPGLLDRLGISKIDDNLPEAEKKKLRINRNTAMGMVFLAVGTAAGMIWFCIHYG
jgi:hypothetical protein